MTVTILVLDRLEHRSGRTGLRFDEYPFIFLTLILSLQASYAAPLILLAQNRQEARDRVAVRAGPRRRRPDPGGHGLPGPGDGRRCGWRVGELATRDFLRSELQVPLLGELEPSATPSSEDSG